MIHTSVAKKTRTQHFVKFQFHERAVEKVLIFFYRFELEKEAKRLKKSQVLQLRATSFLIEVNCRIYEGGPVTPSPFGMLLIHTMRNFSELVQFSLRLFNTHLKLYL